MTRAMPSFVTLTGVDHQSHIPELSRLSQRFSGRVEFGVLISKEASGSPRFPDAEAISAIRQAGLRLSAHVCGSLAEDIFKGQNVDLSLAGFSRVQVNLLGRHATSDEVENAIWFGRTRGIRTILQCGSLFPEDPRCDWLLDNSYGQGRPLTTVPNLSVTTAFCGISGGLTSETVSNVLAAAGPELGEAPFWLDAESALFEGGQFSPAACSKFLNEIFTETLGENL